MCSSHAVAESRGFEPMNILVTGAGSKAGVEMARRLQAAGAHVRTTTHLPSHAVGGAMGAGVAVDFRRPESLGPAFAGIDKAVLITPEESTMVSMTENLIVAARRAQVSHVVLVSFLHADSRAGGTLLGWHRRAEEVVMASGVLSTCLRPNYYMQNFLSAWLPRPHLAAARSATSTPPTWPRWQPAFCSERATGA
jgi:uncharacterized protein YbjT (DUF2867 family)